LEVAKTLAIDASARIACPACGRGVLAVSDEPIWDGTRFERWLRCNACGAWAAMLMAPDQAARPDGGGPAAEGEKRPNGARDKHEDVDWNEVARLVFRGGRR
jgi:hypothetical protein